MAMVCIGMCYPRNEEAYSVIHKQVDFLSRTAFGGTGGTARFYSMALALETVSQLTGRDLQFMDGCSKVNRQHPVWKANTVFEDGKNKSACWVELHAVLQ